MRQVSVTDAIGIVSLELDGKRLGKRLDIPRIGEHSMSVASELGCARLEIEQLIAEGVLGAPGGPADSPVT